MSRSGALEAADAVPREAWRRRLVHLRFIVPRVSFDRDHGRWRLSRRRWQELIDDQASQNVNDDRKQRELSGQRRRDMPPFLRACDQRLPERQSRRRHVGSRIGGTRQILSEPGPKSEHGRRMERHPMAAEGDLLQSSERLGSSRTGVARAVRASSVHARTLQASPAESVMKKYTIKSCILAFARHVRASPRLHTG